MFCLCACQTQRRRGPLAHCQRTQWAPAVPARSVTLACRSPRLTVLLAPSSNTKVACVGFSGSTTTFVTALPA
jgi:hypothetical protein